MLHPEHLQRWDPDLGLYYLRARYLNPGTGRFMTMDTFEGAQTDPLSLHKYLYAANNPVNGFDPTGLFTQRFGYLAEAAIQAVYMQDHPGDAVLLGEWSRFPSLFKLKPDMLNFTTLRWAEVKPFSPSGVIAAADSYARYLPFSLYGFLPDAGWAPSTHFALAGTVPIIFWNAGGIIFYTDFLAQDFLEDVFALVTVKLAQDYMWANAARIATRSLMPALARIGQLALLPRAADGARFQQQLGIAGIVATGGAL